MISLHPLRRPTGHPAAGIAKAFRFPVVLPVLAASLVLTVSGCKSTPAEPDDTVLAASVQRQLAADSSLSGIAIQPVVKSGIAILNGTVTNDAQRSLAERDAASVTGIKTVVNNISVAPAVSAAPQPATIAAVPAPAPAPLPARAATPRAVAAAPVARRTPAAAAPAPAPIERTPAPVAAATPAAPPAPVYKDVTVPAGHVLPVRMTQTLDSATTQEGQTFSGVLSSDVVVDGLVAIPAGSSVAGRVDAVQEAAHFKGSSLLTVSLTGLTRRGERITLASEPYSVEGKGRGKNTAIKTGGGAAVGAVLGGIFGGGKGAAIGAAAGAGTGAGVNAITRGEQVQIASESIVRFRLASPISLRVRADGTTARDATDPTLQRHRNTLPE